MVSGTKSQSISAWLSEYGISGTTINIVGHGVKDSDSKNIQVYNGNTLVLSGTTKADEISIGGSINIYINGATSTKSIQFSLGDYANYTTSDTSKGVRFNGTTYTKTGYWFTGWATENATNTTGESVIYPVDGAFKIYMCWSTVYTITVTNMKPDGTSGWTYYANGNQISDGIFATNALSITCYGTQFTDGLNIPAVTATKDETSYTLTQLTGTAGGTSHNPDTPTALAFDMNRTYACVWSQTVSNISIRIYPDDTSSSYSTISAYKDSSNVYIPVSDYTNFASSKATEYYSVGSIGKMTERGDLAGFGITTNSTATFQGKNCYKISISDFSKYYASSTGDTYNSFIQWKGVNEDKLTWNGTSITGGNGSTIAIPDYYYNGSHFAVTTISIPGLKYSGNSYVTSTKISTLVIGRKISSITDIANMGVGTFVSVNSKYTTQSGCLLDGTTMLSAGKTSPWVNASSYSPGAYMGNKTISSVTNFNATLVPLLFYNSSVTSVTISGLGSTAGYGNPYSCNVNASKEGEWNFQVGYNCFNGSSLSSISFTSGYSTSVSVEDYAFSGCNMGSGFGLFNYITRVDQGGLSNCGDMSSFDASNWSMNYCWEDAFSGTKLPSNVTITANKLGKNCFQGSDISVLTLNNSVEPLLREGNDTKRSGGLGRELGEISELNVPNNIVRSLMSVNDNYKNYVGLASGDVVGDKEKLTDDTDMSTTPVEDLGDHVETDENDNKQIGDRVISSDDKIVYIDDKYVITENYVRKLLATVRNNGMLYICGSGGSIPSSVISAFPSSVVFVVAI